MGEIGIVASPYVEEGRMYAFTDDGVFYMSRDGFKRLQDHVDSDRTYLDGLVEEISKLL